MFQVDILVRADLLGSHTAVLSGCCSCRSFSAAPKDVGGPSGSLRGPPIVISLDVPRLSSCKRKSSLAPVSLDVSRPSRSKSTATYSSSLACFSNLQWYEFRDLIFLPLFTVIILPFTPITEKGRGSNAGVRTSALLCFKRTWSPATVRRAFRAFRLSSAYSFVCFF